jgi:hypothetical protein
MDLKEFLSVTGKPGLCKIIAKNKTGMIVESIIDKKRFPVYTSDKIINMEDVSIYTTGEDMQLGNVFKKIFDKENGGKSIDHKSDDKKLREYFEQILPEYDKDRVYASDIRKVINWYNILQSQSILDFSEKPEELPAEVDNKAETDVKTEKPKKTVKKAVGGAEKKTSRPKTVTAKKEK